MTAKLRFGLDSQLSIDAGPDTFLTVCDAPHNAAVADPARALTEAIASPLDFPALGQAIIPGDRVAIALGDGVPQVGPMTAALIESLLKAGVGAGDIVVLVSPESAESYGQQFEQGLPEAVRRRIEIAVHDRGHRDQLSYLAADHEGEAVYINRRLFDADVVLPVGCVRLEAAGDSPGVNGALYPTFSDAAALNRYRENVLDSNGDGLAERRREADEVAWLLGVLMTIQIVPGAADDVLHVIAGHAESVERQASALAHAAWNCPVPRRSELVIAAIDGGDQQQTWNNLARALEAAGRVVTTDGVIALCTELAEPPGPALRSIAGAQDFDDAMRSLRGQQSEDTAAAYALAQALDRNRVYLLSRLDESTVEELGMAPVASLADLSRLASHHESCLLLPNAQYTQPSLVGEEANDSNESESRDTSPQR